MKILSRKILSLLTFLSVAFLSSCVKEDGVFTDDGNPGIIEIADLPSRSTSTVYSFVTKSFDAVAEVEFPVTINYTGVNGAPNNVSIEVGLNDQALDAYNAANVAASSTFVPYDKLDASLYSIASSALTIKQGEKKATFIIKLKTAQFDFKKRYAIAVSVKSASNGTISRNYGTGIFRIVAKNKYDGVYSVENLVFNNVTSSAHKAGTPRVRHLITSGANENSSYDPTTGAFIYFLNGTSGSYYGNFNPIFTFDEATGNVTAVTNAYPGNSQGREAKLDPTGVNKITISGNTKVLEVSYIMTVSGVNTLFLKEKWTYTGARP